MRYACKVCKETLVNDGPGFLQCKPCRRDGLVIPEAPGANVGLLDGDTGLAAGIFGANGKIKSHGNPRIEAKAGEAYQPEPKEFPLEDRND